ncbi:hypothetical protein CEE45_15255 [Candidatus Heimdallarchaeota archaeon B3_Heim]|nr:MAG: hypothetical protein CEE45_15255 [Candidatus Heimdallarchaeota archaeon B3_Heim]
MEEGKVVQKKLKICFIDMVQDRKQRYPDMWLTPYSTFYGYDFDKDIQSRVSEQFGWSTDLEKLINSHSVELNLHIISYSFLRKQGVVQKFRSKHGRDYDDHYSYLEGMNVLAIEGTTEVHLKYTVRLLWNLFEKKTSIPVPVDVPRIVLLVPKEIHSSGWILSLKQEKNLSTCSDIRDFIYDFDFEDFIDLSLSRGYKHQLRDYLEIFKIF